MVVIRLARQGQKKRPFYHITVADQRFPRDGRFLERIGFYNPLARGASPEYRIELERLNYWVSQGAQVSDTVRQLVKKQSKKAAA